MDEMGGEKGDEARWFIFIPVSFFLFFLSKTKLLGLLWDPSPKRVKQPGHVRQ
jgi:hypothetical protein